MRAPSSPQTASSLGTSSVLSTDTLAEHDGPLRPHLNIPVSPNHGLYGFFRVKTNQNSHSKPRGVDQPEFVALEAPTGLNSSRSWNAAELRRKSFKDLHTLWYVLLRERNLLETQKVERMKQRNRTDPVTSERARNCRKSMARIKAVITERRNAYIHAARLRRLLRRSPEVLQPIKAVESANEEGLWESEAQQEKIS